MRFLIYIPQLIFGGAEKVLVSFANDLVSRGHKVEILELYEKGYLKPQFDPRVSFDAICSKSYTQKYYASPGQIRKNPFLIGKWLFSKVVGYRRFAEKLAAKRYTGKEFDVAINYLEIESPAFLLDHIHAKKYLQWIHIDVANLAAPQELDPHISTWSRMDGIICVSQVAVDSFCKRYPALVDKVHLLYNFYDTADILSKGSKPFSLHGLQPTLLSVGRMTEQKKYLRFLGVLARLRDEGFDFSWHVLGDGIQRPQIEEKIRRSELSDRVYLHGLSDNPYKYMKHCDLFILPSGWEGFPTVTIEAKLLGCPILATDVAGIQEQLIHGKTGWIVDNNEEAIYEGLKILLSDPQKRETLRNCDGMDRICDNAEKYRQLMALLAL
ncbi:MAG: glycosyltransferase [Oscillospiraceae bacterium]|nr:glycosyltransferase [Oscillospiraceae bacterium]